MTFKPLYDKYSLPYWLFFRAQVKGVLVAFMLQIKQAATAWAAACFIIDINGYSAGSMTTVP